MSEPYEEKKDSKAEGNARRIALIGLLGTILTVCGTLTGALIGGGTTIYKAARAAEKLELSDTLDAQALSVDTGKLSITPAEAEELDPQQYLKFPELGFVMEKVLPGWVDRGDLTYADLFQEEAVSLSPLIFYYEDVGFNWDDQIVRQVRYEQPVMVTYLPGSTENGYAADPEDLEFDTVAFHSQMTVLVLDRIRVAPDLNLYNLALKWSALHRGGVNAIIANENSPYVFEQVAWEVNGVEVDGALRNLTLERWALFIEGDEQYYIVEIQYVPGHSTQVWDELQQYFSGFRVIE